MSFTRIARTLAPALLLATLAHNAGAADDATTRLYDHSLRRLHAD